jgi:hypothetical protein
MTSDSDDVADSADQKPPGSLPQQGASKAPAQPSHPTGEKQAEENKANDPPA